CSSFLATRSGRNTIRTAGARSVPVLIDSKPGHRRESQVLTRGDDILHVPWRRGGLAHQGLDVDDPLALLAGNLRPVVRVRRVGQVFVLLELLADGGGQSPCGQALLCPV